MKRMFLLIILTVFAISPLFSTTIKDIIESTINYFEDQVSKPMVLGIGSFTYYADKLVGSSFSSYLEEQFSIAIQSGHKFELAERDRLDEIIDEIKFGLSGLVDEATVVDPGQLKGLQCLLSGRFFDEGINVNVFVKLVSVETGTVIAYDEISIPKILIPQDVSILPDNYDDALFVIDELAEVTNASNTDFVVKAWTKRGNGGVYRDGEKLVINFYSNRDCFIKIYHIDVNGNTQLIFPNIYYSDNFIIAKQIYKIPDSRYPFSFDLGAPFGTEFIKVVASTVQFEYIEESFEDLGRVSAEMLTRGLSIKQKKEQTTESLSSYTIIE